MRKLRHRDHKTLDGVNSKHFGSGFYALKDLGILLFKVNLESTHGIFKEIHELLNERTIPRESIDFL